MSRDVSWGELGSAEKEAWGESLGDGDGAGRTECLLTQEAGIVARLSHVLRVGGKLGWGRCREQLAKSR
jgi:hypothetical protein